MREKSVLSRRGFLVGVAASSAAAILAACGGDAGYPTVAPTQTGSTTGTTGAAPTTGAGAAPTPMTTGMTAPAVPMTSTGQAANIPTPRAQTFVSETVKMQIFDSFNPYIPNGEQGNSGLNQSCREALIYFNSQKGEFIPWLATKWAYNPEFTELTLSLNPKARWNDGMPFTSDDVVFTLNLLRDNANFNQSSNVRNFMESWTNPNANTVVIKLKSPNPRMHYQFTSIISGAGIHIAPKHVWEKQDAGTFKNNPPVYTGPYKLQRTTPQQFQYVWEKNPDYWNRDMFNPKPQFLVWQQAQPTDATVQEFQRGNIDAPVGGAGYTFDYLQQEAIKGNYKNLIQLQFLDPYPRAIWFNQESPSGLFAKAEGRQAVSYLLDRETIGKTIWQPPSTPAKYPWAKYKANDRWENADLQKQNDFVYDPKKAEMLLDGIGATRMGDTRMLNGKPLNITIHTSVAVGLPEYQIAQALAANAKKVGITVDVKSTVGTAFTDLDQLGQWDLKSQWTNGGLDPQLFYRQFWDIFYKPLGERANQNNPGRIRDKEFSDIITKLEVTNPDDPKNKEVFDQGLAAYYRTMPCTPSIQTVYPLAYNNTYWTGWPTQDNSFNVPANWWQNFIFIIGAVQPTGKQ